MSPLREIIGKVPGGEITETVAKRDSGSGGEEMREEKQAKGAL